MVTFTGLMQLTTPAPPSKCCSSQTPYDYACSQEPMHPEVIFLPLHLWCLPTSPSLPQPNNPSYYHLSPRVPPHLLLGPPSILHNMESFLNMSLIRPPLRLLLPTFTALGNTIFIKNQHQRRASIYTMKPLRR